MRKQILIYSSAILLGTAQLVCTRTLYIQKRHIGLILNMAILIYDYLFQISSMVLNLIPVAIKLQPFLSIPIKIVPPLLLHTAFTQLSKIISSNPFFSVNYTTTEIKGLLLKILKFLIKTWQQQTQEGSCKITPCSLRSEKKEETLSDFKNAISDGSMAS